jgi:hypothetical protein
MIDFGVLDILLRSLSPGTPMHLRVLALQGLHALLGDCFSLTDVLADPEFAGYYADCLQLAEEAVTSAESRPVLKFESLTALQRRKVHTVANFAKLYHRSSGPPEARVVTVSVPDAGRARDEFSIRKKLIQDGLMRFSMRSPRAATPRFETSRTGVSNPMAMLQDNPFALPRGDNPLSPRAEASPRGSMKMANPMQDVRMANPIFETEDEKWLEEAPPVFEIEALPELEADPYAESFYEGNRQTLARAGVVQVLTVLVADGQRSAADVEVTFFALDCLLLLNQHSCVAPAQQKWVYDVCCRTTRAHANIGVAVLAAFNLAAILETKPQLFGSWCDSCWTPPAAAASGAARFRRAARRVVIVCRVYKGVRQHDLDHAVQVTRRALR